MGATLADGGVNPVTGQSHRGRTGDRRFLPPLDKAGNSVHAHPAITHIGYSLGLGIFNT
jgi:hypothetical protein